MRYYNNLSYIFIPFQMEKEGDYKNFLGEIEWRSTSPAPSPWDLETDDLSYSFQFFSEKVAGTVEDGSLYEHYRLNRVQREKLGLGKSSDLFITGKHKYLGREVGFRFYLVDAELFCFRTGVGMIAFQISFEKEEPLWVSSALSYIKNASTESISLFGKDTKFKGFLGMAKHLMSSFQDTFPIRYFFYANPGTEIANVLTYGEVPLKDDYRYELFYLRKCYNEEFSYMENTQDSNDQLYNPATDIMWGMSQEASVCLACPRVLRKDYIQKNFFAEFCTRYLFLYTWMLHQKYVWYSYLMKVNQKDAQKGSVLEARQNEVWEFETEYCMPVFTEIPEYQTFCQKLNLAFELDRIREAIHRPFKALEEVGKREKAQQRREKERLIQNGFSILIILLCVIAVGACFVLVEEVLGGIFLNPILLAIKVIVSLFFVILVWIGAGSIRRFGEED